MKTRVAALGAFLLAIGPSLAGAQEPPPKPSTESAAAASQHQSPVMMYVGMSLTGLGAAALVGGAGFFIYDANHGSGYGAAFVGVPLMVGSVVFAGIGVPLWIVGARAPEPKASLTSLMPTVYVAPRSVSVQWSF